MMLNRNIRAIQRLANQSLFLLNTSRIRQLQITPFYTSTRLYTAKQDNYFISKYVKDLMKGNPELERLGSAAILVTYDTLADMGFTSENCLEMISAYPPIVRITPKKLYDRFEMWHICNFTPTQMFELFSECPEFFDFGDERVLRHRLAELKTYVHTDKNVWRLLLSSPNVLTDNMSVFLKKADYLEKVMQVDFTDAVKSGVFGHTLNKLKCRHMLLVRTGIFKPKEKNASELASNKNPRMVRIIDSTDHEFANDVCGISLAELAAFSALYTRELQMKEEDDEEGSKSDDNSDTDHSDSSDEDEDVNKDVETEAFASEKFVKKKTKKFSGKRKPFKKQH